MPEQARRGVAAPLAILVVAAAVVTLPSIGPGLRLGLAVLAGLSILATRDRDRWTAAVCLLWAVLGVAVGTGVGARFLTAGDSRPWVWLALAGLVAALFLLGSAFVRLLTGVRRRWWLPVGVLVILVSVVGVNLLAVPLAATVVPQAPVTQPPPPGFEEVSFPTADGEVLQGWFAPGSRDTAVVVVPGSGSDRTGAADHARMLADDGFAVLVYDPRGHGGSTGRAMDLGWAGDQDLSAAVSAVEQRSDARAIGVLGLSMGGEQALGAAASDSRIAAVVAEGATNRTAADRDWLSEEYGWRGQVQEVLDAGVYGMVDLLTPLSPPITLRDAVAGMAGRPVLLITAGQTPDEGHAAQRMAAQNPAVEIWEIPQAGHTGGLRTAPEEYRSRVQEFFATL